MRRWIRGRRRARLVVPVVLLVASACTGAWLLTRDPSSAAPSTTAGCGRLIGPPLRFHHGMQSNLHFPWRTQQGKRKFTYLPW